MTTINPARTFARARFPLVAGMLCAVLLIATPTWAEGKASVAIQFTKNAAGISPQVASGLVDMMTTALVKSGKFRILERSELGVVADEQLLGSSGAVDYETAARTGMIAGADYMLIGIVTEGGDQGNAKGKGISLGGISFRGKKTRLAVDVRFIDTETSEVKFAETFVSEKKQRDVGVGFVDVSLDEGPLAELAREVVNGIARKTVFQVYPPKVVDFDEATQAVYLSYGESMLSVGDSLEIFELGREIKDPDTGEVIGNVSSSIGKLVVSSVQPKMSIGTLLSGTAKSGAECRFTNTQAGGDSKSGSGGGRKKKRKGKYN